MYIYQDGKLYVQDGDVLIGVEIYSDKIVLLPEITSQLGLEFETLTLHEVMCRWQISEGNAYVFPREVVADDAVAETKVATRKPRSK